MAFTAIAACAPPGGAAKSDSATTAADLAAIGKIRDTYATAFKAGDAATITGLYTSDGFTLTDNQPTGMGQAGVAASLKGFWDQFTFVSFTLTPVKTEASGNLGYDVGTYAFTAIAKPKGDTVKADGRYVVLLRKGADGTWKVIADMDNTTTMPAMPPSAPPAKGKKK